jgi:cell division cycle 2-like protein
MWLNGCRSVDSYRKLNRIEEGTYGVVFRAQDRDTGEVVALKKLKLEKEREGFPVTSLREINALMQCNHPHVVRIREMVVGREMNSVYIVMDFVEHDLRSLMDDMPNPFTVSEVKTLLKQLLCAVAAMHERWILHRDLKTSNLLLNNRGEIRVADFGLARRLGSPPIGALTPVVVTLWYRSPELLLGEKEYSWSVDIWSVGCILAELLINKPIFPGKSEIDQIDKIFRILGMPNDRVWPGFSKLQHASKVAPINQPYNCLDKVLPMLSPAGLDLIGRLLAYDPMRRPTAREALDHPFFSEGPLPKDPALFPTWPSRSAEERRSRNTPEAPHIHQPT